MKSEDQITPVSGEVPDLHAALVSDQISHLFKSFQSGRWQHGCRIRNSSTTQGEDGLGVVELGYAWRLGVFGRNTKSIDGGGESKMNYIISIEKNQI